MSFSIQFTTVAIATALAFAGHVEAAPASMDPVGTESMSVRVSVADLDLSQPAGLATAHERIRRAAVAVCGSQSASAGLAVYELYSDCRKTAFNDAMMDLNTKIASTLAPQAAPRATTLAATEGCSTDSPRCTASTASTSRSEVTSLRR